MNKKIVLASASPRRRELLSQIGWEFEVIPGKGEEIITEKEPSAIVMQLAGRKAEEVFERCREQNVFVIGADTIVVHNGKIMGKPGDREDALRMLTDLCGDVHQVYTGVSFYWEEEGKIRTHAFYECTDVFVYPAEKEELQDYIDTGDPMDKAGAYGIQGRFARWIQKIDGDYNNVVGLPVGRLYQEAKKIGLCVK